MPTSAEVTLRSDTEIVVIRDFAAPRPLVFSAFTLPALVRRWLLGPPGWSMPVCDIDLRVGGNYRYRWRNEAEGQEFGLLGTFDRIDPNRAIDGREAFEDVEPQGEFKVSTAFEDHGEGTRIVYVITCGSKEARDAAIATGMTDGMEMSFKMLDRVLAE